MTPSKPLLTVLRLGAVVLAVGVGGYLVVGAQQRASGSGESTPERTLAQPAGVGESEEGAAGLTDPFLYSSKSAAIVVTPDVTAIEDEAGGEFFLPSSKDPGPDVLRAVLGTSGDELRGKVAPGQEGTYLPSSKILSPDVLRANNGSGPPPPIDPAYLRSSKSLTIDGSLLTPKPAGPDPNHISSDGLVIPNDDVRAAWEKLTDEEKRAIYLTTSKSLSPDALPGTKGGTTMDKDAADADGATSKESAKDAPTPKKD